MAIQYKIVADICNRLEKKNGKEPSYQDIAFELREDGHGTPTKGHVLEHKRTWKEHKRAEATVEMTVSPEFQKALVDELAAHIGKAEEKAAQQIADARKFADEALTELKRSDATIERLEAELATEKTKRTDAENQRDKDAAVSVVKVSGLEAALKDKQIQLEKAEKTADNARNDIDKVNEQLITLAAEVASAEKSAAVTAEKLTAALAKIKDLETLPKRLTELEKALDVAEKAQSKAEIAEQKAINRADLAEEKLKNLKGAK